MATGKNSKRSSSVKKGTSVLDSQQPIKRKRSRLFYIIPTLVFVFTAVFFLKKPSVDLFKKHYDSLVNKQKKSQQPKNWQITFSDKTIEALEKDERQQIIKTGEKFFKKSPNIDFRVLAKKIAENENFAQVHVLKKSASSVIISVNKYQPIAAIYADKWRLISKDGKVFGLLKENSSKLKKISGVFSEHVGKFTFANDHSLKTSQKQKAIIAESMTLMEHISENNLNVSIIEYKPYRGFFIFLSDKNIKVALGRAPFENNFKRLFKVLENLKKKDVETSLIELDYANKAFIKKKSG